jgi:hypothetical protein
MVHPLSLITSEEIEASTKAVRQALAKQEGITGHLRWIEVTVEEPWNEEDRQDLMDDPNACAFGSEDRKARVIVYCKFFCFVHCSIFSISISIFIFGDLFLLTVYCSHNICILFGLKTENSTRPLNQLCCW